MSARDRLEARADDADRNRLTSIYVEVDDLRAVIADLDAATAARDALLNDLRALCDDLMDKRLDTATAAYIQTRFRALIERHTQAPQTPTTCEFGDQTCPCQDGDVCHYVDDPTTGTRAIERYGGSQP